MTEQEVRDGLDAYNEFMAYVKPIFKNYIAGKYGPKHVGHLDEETMRIENDHIVATGSESWRYGGHEDYGYEMPVEMLWAADLAEAMAVEARRKEAEQLEQRRLEEERRKAEAERQEREHFERLKRKFGGTK